MTWFDVLWRDSKRLNVTRLYAMQGDATWRDEDHISRHLFVLKYDKKLVTTVGGSKEKIKFAELHAKVIIYPPFFNQGGQTRLVSLGGSKKAKKQANIICERSLS